MTLGCCSHGRKPTTDGRSHEFGTSDAYDGASLSTKGHQPLVIVIRSFGKMEQLSGFQRSSCILKFLGVHDPAFTLKATNSFSS